MAYQIGQYRYTGNGCVSKINPVVSYKAISVEGEEVTTSSFQDVQISPAGGVFVRDQDYYMKILVPQDLNYDMSFNLRLTRRDTSEEQFQFLKKVTITRGGSGANVYNVVLYEKNDGSVAAMIPHQYTEGSNIRTVTNEVYYDPNTNRYFLGNNTTRPSTLVNYNNVSIVASWLQSETDNFGVFEVIFRPVDDNFTHLHLQMIRTAEDYNIQSVNPNTGYTDYGRKVNIDKMQVTIYTINNLVPQMTDVGRLDRIGVWGHPGLMMVINGEEIQVGPSGYYELDVLPIESLGVVAPEQNYSNMFTIDYQYTIS